MDIRTSDRQVLAETAIVTTINDNVAESSERCGSKAAAIELAASLGYTEVV